MSNPKVFEFAKEIGLTPLALMDKIREWHLPIKSHMAELDIELMAVIRSRLSEASLASEPEKKVAKKKAVVATGSAEKSTVKKTATPVAGPVKVTKMAPAKTTAKTATKAAEPVPAAKSAATVVRRKKVEPVAPTMEEKAEIEQEVIEEPIIEVEQTQIAAPIPAANEVVIGPAIVAKEKIEIQEKISEKITDKVEIKEEAAKLTVKPITKVQEAKPAPVVAATPIATKPATTTEPSVASAAKTVTTTFEEVAKKAFSPARKKEVAIGASGVSSEQTAPAAPRRNIVGRMDLSRVQRPPGYQPRTGGTDGRPQSSYTPGGGAAGAANRPKGNLRAGFFQAPAVEIPFEVPALGDDRKKDDKRRMKGGPNEGPGAARELDAQPPAFDAAEFRKREMVFQPKKKKGMLARPAMHTQVTKAAAHKRIVKVFGTMKVSDVAQSMGIKVPALIKVLMKNGVTASMNMDLDFDTISLIVPEFGFEAQNIQKTAMQVIEETADLDANAELVIRPPVVAVMGHVDHGKTSLLDAIRKANVAAGEAGGITQHIGAYQVTLDDGYKITFLDTPGHEAFTSMRARGANVTDIAIIVVAADDGVMPQTAEAINHAKAAKVPMIVVVNKIDKPGANPERIKQQLTEYEVVPEEWGGTTIFAQVSAVKKTGIKELLEQIKVLAEVMELKSNPKRSATGTVIESRLEKGRGSVATILVQDGTVEVGQYMVAGAVPGRVRSLMNDLGERVQTAGPGMPVEVLGLDGVPQAGDKFDIVRDERVAQDVAKIRQEIIDAAKNSNKKMSLEEIFSKAKAGDVKELSVVLKADVAGSLEAIQGMFQKLSTPEVKVRVIHSAIGGITETDVMLASTSKGVIIGFNVRPDTGAQTAAKRYGIDVRTYSVVYEMVDEMKKAMAGLLAPNVVETVSGRAEIRNTFTVPKVGTIAGCMVSDGKILRANMARLIRDGKIVYEGKISSLKRFKDDAREVAAGFECGIGIENFNDLKAGDIIEAFSKEEVARELSSPSAGV